MIVYVSIGNSDDKLTQAEWAAFVEDAGRIIERYAAEVHGTWESPSSWAYQNACWCMEIEEADCLAARRHLTVLRMRNKQDSVAWAVAQTEFI